MSSSVQILALAMLGLAGCATGPERAAPSTKGCAEAVVRQLPPGLDDAEQHCLASALIARQCSSFEAVIVGTGKEARDAVGVGDASRRDLDANRVGRECAARGGAAPGELLECCRAALMPQ
jgi:hypothetical protein